MMKAILVDIDGPMIPMRAYFLPQQTPIVSIFDPCAVSMLLRLVDISQAKLVVSSSWGSQGYDRCMEVFTKNGIRPELFHKDWITPRKMSSSRTQEIMMWLDRHPEVTHYVAIDDEGLDYEVLPCSVLCDAHEGFSWRNYLECCVHLDSYTHDDDNNRQKYLSQIEYFKRREIWRTKRYHEPGAYLVREAADLVFPLIPENKDE
jgi:HAD domain in Swiss Army Knife RNA repair proteins